MAEGTGRRREVLAEKLMDVANIAIAAMVFGQVGTARSC